jgi:hypothetical protein
LEAESVAYVICRALSLETGGYSFGYVVGWSSGEQAVRRIKGFDHTDPADLGGGGEDL